MDENDEIEEVDMLDDAIQNAIDELNRLEPGSKERDIQAREVEELYKLWNDQQRIACDERKHDLDVDTREKEIEEQHRETDAKIEEQKREHKIDTIVKVAGGVASFFGYCFVAGMVMIFEQDGTLRSQAGRNHISRITNFFPFPKNWKTK